MTKIDYNDLYFGRITESDLLTMMDSEEGETTIRHALQAWKQDFQELSKEYRNGDRDVYPPDWYDAYVYPIECAIRITEDVIELVSGDDDDDFPETWY